MASKVVVARAGATFAPYMVEMLGALSASPITDFDFDDLVSAGPSHFSFRHDNYNRLACLRSPIRWGTDFD